MKRIFTLITTALLALSAWADAPEFIFQDKATTNGETYYAPYTVDDMGFMKVYEQQSYLSLKGIKGKEVTLSVNADSIIAVCGLTGQCINTKSDTRSAILGEGNDEIADGEPITIDLEIHGEGAMVFDDSFDPSNDLPIVTIEAKAWYTDSPDDVATVKVILTNKTAEELAGIADVVSDSSADITFISGNVLNYNISNPTKLEIYNTTGALVLSRKIASVGSISLDVLAPGIYIYAAANKSGKILVR